MSSPITLKKHLVYVVRDIERAVGIEPGKYGEFGYYIITNSSPYALKIKSEHPDFVWLISSPEPLDTYEILSMKEVQDTIKNHKADLLVFKNTARIEELAKEKGWNLINPKAALGEEIENKITQPKWLGDLASLLPKYSITKAKDIVWQGTPFVIQWAHGHTGDGTTLITGEPQLKEIKTKFPEREARVVSYIDGPVFTVNIVVQSNNTLRIGNISYQITGMLPFTDRQFATIGNDWAVPHSILSVEEVSRINDLGQSVGEHMARAGWKGLFGVDVIYNHEQHKAYLLEINARQPASSTLESILQNKNRSEGLKGLTIFESHINALVGGDTKEELIVINDGAQIVQRVTEIILKNTSTPKAITSVEILTSMGYDPIVYTQSKIGSDLVRIRSTMGIMEAHLKFNKRGKEIVDTIL
jgi:hypothetical protein